MLLRPKARLVGVVVAVGILFALPAVAVAHAELDTASPGPGSQVESQPEALLATFTEPVDPAKTTIEVRDTGGVVVAKGGAAEVDDTGLTMTVPLPILDDGTYEVRWTTAALDGHIERGTYRFTVAIVAAASPSLEASFEPPGSPSPAASPGPSASTASPSSVGPSANPSASPTPSVSAATSPVVSPSPAPSTVGDGPAAADGTTLLLPVLAALAVVAGLGVWFLRRRRA